MSSVRIVYLLLVFCFCTSVFSQDLDWLKNSTSNDVFTSHSFYASCQHNDDFYFAGDFWKDLTIDGVNIEIAGDLGNGFILKMDKAGTASGLWHFKSDDYVRINSIEVNPVSKALIVTGNFNQNLIYDDEEWNVDFYSKGFIMSINTDGSLIWMKEISPLNEFSFAIGNGIAIDDQGNIFVGFEAGGEIEIESQNFVFEPETAGAVIAKFNIDGDLISAVQWNSQSFESWIDIVDMAITEENDLLIGGSFSGPIEVYDSSFIFTTATSSNFLVRQDNSLNLKWLKNFSSNRSSVLDILVDEDDLLLSVQYNGSINVDGDILNGTGSWGEMAIIALEGTGEVKWAKNFTLNENGGNSGVYGKSISLWNNQYYIAGTYQGDVLHEGDLILDNNASGPTYQYPFIISLDKSGNLTSVLDFFGSSEPGRISSISANESHLLFGGDFSGQIVLGDTSVSTINSALFYGALSKSISKLQQYENGLSLFEIYPNVSSDVINISTESSLTIIELISSHGVVLKKYPGNSRIIDISDLPAGLYLLSTAIEGRIGTKKFVKR